jgi:hypothetical protein
MQIPLGIHNLNQLMLISKNWLNDSQFGCETFVAKSLDDFRDLEANLFEQMEEEFEDQLGDYVELVDPTDFDL